jgi:hypothetical protein
MNDLDEGKIVTKRDLLQEQYQIIASLSPQTNSDDYQKAQKTLLGKTVSDEEFTWSDSEIDRFLPRELRLSKNN